MEKRHKQILKDKRPDLVESLNMIGGLFTQLISRDILDQRMVRTIKNGKTEDEMAEGLLDFLPKSNQGEKTFDLFCEALIADSQSSIVRLYLKPDSKKETEEKNVVQESNGASAVNETLSQVSGSQVTGLGPTYVNIGEGVEYRDGERSVQSPGHVQTVAIREELQTQMYRRSIEPRDLHHSQSSPNLPSNSEHDAMFFYQSTLRNPHAVYSVLNDRCSNRSDKERQLFNMGLPLASVSQIMNDYYIDPLLVSDSGGIGLPKNVSSKDISQNPYAQKPHVFNRSPYTEITPASSGLVLGMSPQKSFAFQTRDKNYPPVLQERHFLNASKEYMERVQGVDRSSEQELENIYCKQNEELFSDKIKQNYERYNENSSSRRNLTPQVEEIHPSPSRYSEARSMVEIDRHIETNNSCDGSLQRSMMSFPRHVKLLPTAGHPDLHGKDSLRGDNGQSPRLLIDDTMHKRPLTEEIETGAKRFREDVDTCSLPNLIRPERTPTLPVLEARDDQIVKIPVLEEPWKQPSMPAVVVQPDQNLEKNQRSSLLGAMDDPEIDLTDGPINVNVELSTRKFYLEHYKQAYAMRRIPRGKALIMNVNEVVGKSARRGTDIDRDNLHNLLCQMHFDVTVYNDADGLTAMEMVQKLQDFSQHSSHVSGDCAVVCILSHGEEGYIFGADGKKFELDAVFSLFDNTCCPSLRGKPKLFIIQACRGGALDRGVQYYPDEHDGSDARVRQVPSMSDMLICYPTQNGYYAWRNRDRGSWYVEALVQIFMKYARCEDVCTMLNRVNLLVSKKVSHCPNIDMDQMSQMSEYKSTLRMPHLYFFPGIGGCS
ncbi:uncharacterized protein LOC132724398 [Ruditapes philippinarum]|uniref:uncharacterized protein LOC132724398 n=1 Tax=Ruditapes philippinarum TaxID=129788 RepID=UPI00295BF8BE|nr:uncharacterized protein LOC132724398 [Ruditapes philippinarum]